MRTKKEIVRLIDEELEIIQDEKKIECIFCCEAKRVCGECAIWDKVHFKRNYRKPKKFNPSLMIELPCRKFVVEIYGEFSEKSKKDLLLQTRYQLTGSFDGWAE